MAHLQFDNHVHVTDYKVEDRVYRKKGQSENEPIKEKIDSYWLLKFMTKGCTAFGIDIDETGFDSASANAFRYLRALASKLKAGGKA